MLSLRLKEGVLKEDEIKELKDKLRSKSERGKIGERVMITEVSQDEVEEISTKIVTPLG